MNFKRNLKKIFYLERKKRKTRENLSANTAYPNRRIQAYLDFSHSDSIIKFLTRWCDSKWNYDAISEAAEYIASKINVARLIEEGSLAHSNLVLPYRERRETKRKKMKGRGRTVTKQHYIWIWKNDRDIFKATSLTRPRANLAKSTSNFPKESLDRCYKREIYFVSFYFASSVHLKIANRSLKFYITTALNSLSFQLAIIIRR